VEVFLKGVKMDRTEIKMVSVGVKISSKRGGGRMACAKQIDIALIARERTSRVGAATFRMVSRIADWALENPFA
jgi:hypothetical protein